MNASSFPVRPVKLRKDGEEALLIDWSDGHTSRHTWNHLRLNCPCASCREERSRPPDPFRILKPHEIPRGPLKPVAVRPVGYYAYSIQWNDGHNTGIYTFDLLRSLCQCPQCQPGTKAPGESRESGPAQP
jgi:DUF971 family protein